eukprot:CAMPEP_0170181864 /NCGR_PEP_ID=MMETSP0040_2-20121228/26223_1 /TAXON_ID=641309 /ORGANISM="Lotharella oceanica, Strain CCMP622" /LENGTH=96 /DNA_ID=CAMNT_0010427053 /DNA_START=629 /DNA_END=919 /DNA_ORIENTATION=+
MPALDPWSSCVSNLEDESKYSPFLSIAQCLCQRMLKRDPDRFSQSWHHLPAHLRMGLNPGTLRFPLEFLVGRKPGTTGGLLFPVSMLAESQVQSCE